MTLEPFKPEHLYEIDVQDAQLYLKPHFPQLAEYYAEGEGYTWRTDRVLACAGFIWTDLGAHLWAIVGKDTPLLPLHRLALRAFEVYPVRVSATVETGFPAGCRWLKSLGFEIVDFLTGYGPDNRDHYVYARTP